MTEVQCSAVCKGAKAGYLGGGGGGLGGGGEGGGGGGLGGGGEGGGGLQQKPITNAELNHISSSDIADQTMPETGRISTGGLDLGARFGHLPGRRRRWARGRG